VLGLIRIKYGTDECFHNMLRSRVVFWDKFNKQVFLKVHLWGGGAICYVELAFDVSTMSSECV